MDPMQPENMIAQVKAIPDLMRSNAEIFDKGEHGVKNALTRDEMKRLSRIWIVGNGDSYHAARATELFFKTIAKVQVEAASSQPFLDYGLTSINRPGPRNLVLGISASGRTVRVATVLEKAKAAGNLTLALTGNLGQPVPDAAERVIEVAIPPMAPTPGIRNYTATLMGLYLFAIAIGEAKGNIAIEEGNRLRTEIVSIADIAEATLNSIDPVVKEAVESLKDAEIMLFAGSGPSCGTAMFSAAKLVEAAAVFSFATDLEEWAHVEGIAYPNDMPTFVIAPRGRGHWRAVKLASDAKKRMRRVVVVAENDDAEIAEHAHWHIPVMGSVREEFSPLVYQLFSVLLGSYLATALQRLPFQTDNPEFHRMPAAAGGIRPTGG